MTDALHKPRTRKKVLVTQLPTAPLYVNVSLVPFQLNGTPQGWRMYINEGQSPASPRVIELTMTFEELARMLATQPQTVRAEFTADEELLTLHRVLRHLAEEGGLECQMCDDSHPSPADWVGQREGNLIAVCMRCYEPKQDRGLVRIGQIR